MWLLKDVLEGYFAAFVGVIAAIVFVPAQQAAWSKVVAGRVLKLGW